jgi:hypothetical protein
MKPALVSTGSVGIQHSEDSNDITPLSEKNTCSELVDTITRLFESVRFLTDRLCGLVVRVLDYRSRGPGFDSRALPEKM